MSDKKAAPRKEYEVKTDTHVHKGKPVKKGGKIDLTDKQAARLKEIGVI